MLNFEGWRKRESYNEIVHYIQAEQPKLKYPNRRASFLLNTHQFSSLLEQDGMDEQEEEIKKAQVVQSLGPTLLTQHIEKRRWEADQARASLIPEDMDLNNPLHLAPQLRIA